MTFEVIFRGCKCLILSWLKLIIFMFRFSFILAHFSRDANSQLHVKTKGSQLIVIGFEDVKVAIFLLFLKLTSLFFQQQFIETSLVSRP